MSCLQRCLDLTNVQAETDRVFEIKRTRTDVTFFSVMATFMVILVALLAYCFYYGDIARITNGHDSCGNVCGKKNSLIYNEYTNCSSMDHTKNKFLIIIGEPHNLTKQCVADCSKFGCRPVYRTCVPKNSSVSVFLLEGRIGDLHRYWRGILFICLIALALSVAILLLLRFFPAFTVWFILITTIATLCFLVHYFWKQWESSGNPDFRILAICCLVAAAGIFLLVARMRIRIQLVNQLFRESGIALTSMPLLLIRPLLTFSCIATLFCMWIYIDLWIESSGKLTMIAPNMYYYEKDTFMLITRWYNIIVAFWMIQFTISCQHMVIGGAVSAWYFARDKSRLKCPVCISAYNLLRYHLGSIAMGSFITTLAEVAYILLLLMKAFSSDTEKHNKLKHRLEKLEKIWKFLQRNIYVEIALRGYSFFAACKRTLEITKEHIPQVNMISAVADIVMWCGQFLVVSCAFMSGFVFLKGMEDLLDAVIIAVLLSMFSFFAARCFTSAYKMTIDTMLLCFCEDCEINDGISRPYYTNRGLKEFVETSKRILASKDSPSDDTDNYIAQASEFLSDKIFQEQLGKFSS